MKISKPVATAAFVLASALGATHASAQAAIEDGLYVIEVFDRPAQGDEARYAGCMILSNNGSDTVPSLYDWHLPNTSWCGLSGSREGVLHNRQAVWEIRSVSATTGERAYILTSRVNGLCLIRGANGAAAYPSLHRWTEFPSGDDRFCGFPTADQLIWNGQAAWTFDTFDVLADAFIAVAAWTGSVPTGLLSFAKAPSAFPNTADRDTFAAFGDTNPWLFVFRRADR